MTVKWDDADVLARVRQAAMRGVVRGTEAVLEEADSLQRETPRTGRRYGKHVASSPGNAPAPDTGRLRQSLRSEYDQAELSGTAIASTEYAAALEFGTANIAPRPFMRPALANKHEEIERDIAKEIESALK